MIKDSGEVSAKQVYIDLLSRLRNMEENTLTPEDRIKIDAIPDSAGPTEPVALQSQVPDITGLTQRVTDAEGEIDDIQSIIPSGASIADPLVIQSQVPDITGLTQRVMDAEGEIDDIQSIIPSGASIADPLVIQSQIPNVPTWALEPSKPSYTPYEVGALVSITGNIDDHFTDLPDGTRAFRATVFKDASGLDHTWECGGIYWKVTYGSNVYGAYICICHNSLETNWRRYVTSWQLSAPYNIGYGLTTIWSNDYPSANTIYTLTQSLERFTRLIVTFRTNVEYESMCISTAEIARTYANNRNFIRFACSPGTGQISNLGLQSMCYLNFLSATTFSFQIAYNNVNWQLKPIKIEAY